MRVEYLLLRLAQIGPDEIVSTMAEAKVRDLDRDRFTVELDRLVAPIELVGLPRCEH